MALQIPAIPNVDIEPDCP